MIGLLSSSTGNVNPVVNPIDSTATGSSTTPSGNADLKYTNDTIDLTKEIKQVNTTVKQNSTKNKAKNRNKKPNKPSIVNEASINSSASEKQLADQSSRIDKNPPTTVLLGDSMVKNISGWSVGKEIDKRFVVKAFSGARIADMEHYIKPTLNQDPSEIVLHCGTNDLKHKDPKDVAESLIELARRIESSSTSKVTISELICRTDPSINAKVKSTNSILKKFCNQDGRDIINHNNISTTDINRGGVHLKTTGNKTLFTNIVNHFKSN